MTKTVPFNKAKIEEIIQTYPTPFHIYDEAAMIANAHNNCKLHFRGMKGSKNFLQ
jgi:diaminopimelate decarboxylase